MAIEMSRRRLVADLVQDELMARLMGGSLAPGQALSIDGLSRELAVSPTPVREALARIEGAGLVTREPLYGYRVSPPLTVEGISDLMAARILIEPENAAHACLRRSEDLIAALAVQLDDMRAAPTGPTYRQFKPYLDADAEFHQVIALHGGNPFLAEMVRHLGPHVHRFRLFGANGVTDAEESIAEHETVFEAVRDGTAEDARRQMIRHLEGVRDRAVAAAKALGR